MGEQTSSTAGLLIGQEAPKFTASNQYGDLVDIKALRGYFSVLLFVLPGCSACPIALKAVQRISHKEINLRILVVAGSDIKHNLAYASEHDIHVPVLTSTPPLLEKFNVQVFPFVMILDGEGFVRSAGVPLDYEQLKKLLLLARKNEPVKTIS